MIEKLCNLYKSFTFVIVEKKNSSKFRHFFNIIHDSSIKLKEVKIYNIQILQFFHKLQGKIKGV